MASKIVAKKYLLLWEWPFVQNTVSCLTASRCQLHYQRANWTKVYWKWKSMVVIFLKFAKKWFKALLLKNKRNFLIKISSLQNSFVIKFIKKITNNIGWFVLERSICQKDFFESSKTHCSFPFSSSIYEIGPESQNVMGALSISLELMAFRKKSKKETYNSEGYLGNLRNK